MTDIAKTIAALEAWSMETGDFHSDRQLADEVLILDGWRVEPDPTFEGGVRWEWGTNPTICASEKSRPHVINDLNTAISVVPRGCNCRLEILSGLATACVWAPQGDSTPYYGRSSRPSVALLIAALKYMQAKR